MIEPPRGLCHLRIHVGPEDGDIYHVHVAVPDAPVEIVSRPSIAISALEHILAGAEMAGNVGLGHGVAIRRG